MQPALPMGMRPIGSVHDNSMAGLKRGARYRVFRLPIYRAIDMIESVRRNRVDQAILRDMHYAAAVP
jgi:hypothetical protein